MFAEIADGNGCCAAYRLSGSGRERGREREAGMDGDSSLAGHVKLQGSAAL